MKKRYLLLIGAAIALLVLSPGRRPGEKLSLEEHSTSADPAIKSRLQFVRYEKSNWEISWYNNRTVYDEQPALLCQALEDDIDNIDVWLQNTKPELVGEMMPSNVFSALVYVEKPLYAHKGKDAVPPPKEVRRYIEPLIGNFRHPFGLRRCMPSGRKAVETQDRDYLHFLGFSKETLKTFFPGRKYLFDLGTAEYATSLGYLTTVYDTLGVAFDEIWAWELKYVNATYYWKSVGPEHLGHLHFYNVGVTTDKESPANPLNIIRKVYRPGDLVVVKLDIDNSKLEMDLIDQIKEDPELQAMISELMFEMHYYSEHLVGAFGKPDPRYTDVFDLFSDLRSRGIYLHYWP